MSKTTELTNEPVPSIEAALSSESDAKPASGEVLGVSPELKAQLIALFTNAEPESEIINLIKANPSLVDVVVEDDNNNTALHCAALYGFVKLAKFLINTYPEKINTANKDNETALEIAVSMTEYKISKYLIKQGAIINDKDRTSVLHIAIKRNDLETAKLLIEKGAVIDDGALDIDQYRKSRSEDNSEEMTQLLLSAKAKQEEERRNKLEEEERIKAAEEARKKVELELYNKLHEELTQAVHDLKFEKIKELVSDRPDLLKKDIIITTRIGSFRLNTQSALNYLIDNSKHKINDCVSEAHNIAKFLIEIGKEHGMSLKANKDIEYFSPFYEALKANIEIATMLAESGQYTIAQICESVATTNKGWDLLENLLSKENQREELIKFIEPLFVRSFAKNKGTFSDGFQKIYDILAKHGYKFIGYEKPLAANISVTEENKDSLIVKILQNTYTDIKDGNLKELLTDLLVEGLGIVLKHPHIKDIFEVAVENNIRSFVYSNHQEGRTSGYYTPAHKIILLLSGVTNLTLLTEVLDAKNAGNHLQYEKLKLNYLKQFMGTFTHEHTHSTIDMLLKNNAKMFAEGDVKQEEILKELVKDYTTLTVKEGRLLPEAKVGIFDRICNYEEPLQTQELPSYFYGNLAEELVRQKYQTEEGKIESQGFFKDLQQCKELVALCSQMFQEKCHAGEVVDPASLYYNFGAAPNFGAVLKLDNTSDALSSCSSVSGAGASDNSATDLSSEIGIAGESAYLSDL